MPSGHDETQSWERKAEKTNKRSSMPKSCLFKSHNTSTITKKNLYYNILLHEKSTLCCTIMPFCFDAVSYLLWSLTQPRVFCDLILNYSAPLYLAEQILTCLLEIYCMGGKEIVTKDTFAPSKLCARLSSVWKTDLMLCNLQALTTDCAMAKS